jgi:hypothetical protein
MNGQHVRDPPLGTESSDSDVNSRNRAEHPSTVLNVSCPLSRGSSSDVHSTNIFTAFSKGMEERIVGIELSLPLKLAVNVSLASSAFFFNLPLSLSSSLSASLAEDFLGSD